MDINEIKIEKEYSLYELLGLGAFPWIKSYNSYLKLALTEREALGVKIFGEGHGTTYRIKGENLIKFLNENMYAKIKEKADKKARSKKRARKIREKADVKIGTKKGLKTDVGRGLKIARKIRKQGSPKAKKRHPSDV